MKVRKIFWLYLFLLIADMAVIFTFSTQNSDSSTQISKGITTDIIEKSGREVEDIRGQDFYNAERFVRKTAHFILFAALGVFSCLSLKASVRKDVRWQFYVIPLIFCILYAASDEYHQTFIKGRNGSAIDVLIDFSGSFAGIVSIWIASKKFSFGIK